MSGSRITRASQVGPTYHQGYPAPRRGRLTRERAKVRQLSSVGRRSGRGRTSVGGGGPACSPISARGRCGGGSRASVANSHGATLYYFDISPLAPPSTHKTTPARGSARVCFSYFRQVRHVIRSWVTR